MPIPYPHGPEWMYSVEDTIAREAYAGFAKQLGDALSASGSVALSEEVVVNVPDKVKFILRYERTPHGGLALMMRAEWSPDSPGKSETVPAAALVIHPV